MTYRYEPVAAALRERIEGGDWEPGRKLPSGNELADEFRVGLGTVRQALAELAAAGLVAQRQGSGTYVSRPPVPRRLQDSRYVWEKKRALLPEEERRKTGATEKDTGLEMKDLEFPPAKYWKTPATEELAELFAIEVGDTLLERIYQTFQKGSTSPFSIGTSFLRYDLIESNPDLLDSEKEPWPGGTLHQLSTVNIEVDKIVDTVTARPPTLAEAEQLEVRPGQPLLCTRKVSYDSEGRVVEVAYTRTPGDRLELTYTTQLPRWSDLDPAEVMRELAD